MPKALNTLATLLQIAIAVALISESAGVVSNGCPMSITSVELFSGDVDWMCSKNFACLTTYCGCVGGSIATVSGATECVNHTATISAAQVCAAARVSCTLGAALQTTMTADGATCYHSTQPLRDAYSQYYYNPGSRSTSNLTSACVSDMCGVLRPIASGTAFNFTFICSLVGFPLVAPPGGSSGGGGGLPHNANCPNATKLYFQNIPTTCPSAATCGVSFCTCLSLTVGSTGCPFQLLNTTHITEAAFQACSNTYVRCLTTAALNMWPGNTYNHSDACQSWSNSVVTEYATFYYSSAKSTTSFYTECAGLLCDSEYFFYSGALAYGSVCTGLSTLPAPPSTGSNGGHHDNGCVSPAYQDFDNIPVTQCPTVKACLVAFCTCAGSTWNETINDCNKFSTPPSITQGQTCISTGLTCLVGQALAMYVPGAGTDNRDPCVAWSVPIAADYAAWFAATNKHTTNLFLSCNSTACSTIGSLGATADQTAGACTFSTLTSTPTYVAPNPCAYACPDSSCSRTIAGCNCTQHAVLGTVGTVFTPTLGSTFDPAHALSVVAFAPYAVANASAPCGTFDFSPFLIFNWKLTNSTGTVATLNASTFYIPAFALMPGASYTLTLKTIGLIPSQTNTQTWTFTTTTPVPFVSITQRGSSVTMSSLLAYTIKTLILDNYPIASPASAWSCTPGNVSVACPTITNATAAYLTIPVGANAGSFTITFTYRGVSSSLALTVVAGAIPIISLLTNSVPIVAIPIIVYLPSQHINLFASVQYSGNVTYSWTVASTVVCTTRTCTVNASSLTQSTAADLSAGTNTPVLNTITVTVADAATPATAATASVQVAVAPTYTLSITVGNKGTPAASSATSLTDSLAFTATSSITTPGAPYDGIYAFGFTYGAAQVPLLTTPTNTGYSALAPLVITGAASSTVTFTGKLLVNGLLATTATATFTIAKPSDLSAVANQLIGDASSITDPGQALAAAANLQALLSSGSDASQAAAIAAAMIDMFTSSLTDFSSQSSDQVGAAFSAMATAIGSLTGASASNAGVKVLNLVALALTAGNFDPANGQGALGVLSNLDAKSSRSTVALLALKMALDATLAVGGTKLITSGGLSISTFKQSADALGGSTMSGDGYSVAMPVGLNLGLDPDAVAATSGAASNDDIFDEGTGGTSPTGGVKTMKMIDENGDLITVANLQAPICIDMGASGATCMYRDEVLNTWVSTGLTSHVDGNGHLICCTTHFTSFGGFQSSASASVMLSLLAALVVVSIQMFM